MRQVYQVLYMVMFAAASSQTALSESGYEIKTSRIDDYRLAVEFRSIATVSPCPLIVDRQSVTIPTPSGQPLEKGAIEISTAPLDPRCRRPGAGQILVTTGHRLPDLVPGTYEVKIDGQIQGSIQVDPPDHGDGSGVL